MWQLALMAGSTALSVYGSMQQARAASDAAKARAMANAQTARQIRLEASGRRLLNLEAQLKADSAIAAGAGARGVQVDSISNLAMLRRNQTRRTLDDLSVSATAENRIANLWADSGAAYRTAKLQAESAGIDALKSMMNLGAAAHGQLTSPGGQTAQTTSTPQQGNYYFGNMRLDIG